MHYALLSQAQQWISAAYGTTDAAVLLEAVNAIRREWYAWFESTQLFVDIEECFEVQKFAFDCNDSRKCYRGITLPFGWESPSAIWFNDRPVQLFDRWRVWQNGIDSPRDCGLSKFDVADTFPTERDLSPGVPAKLTVTALDARDVGKKVVIRGTSIFNAPFQQEFELSLQPQATTYELRALAQPGGFVKGVTEGRVVLAVEGGRVLSIYSPAEQVPSYKRIRIEGLPDGCQHVNIRAARRYIELFDPFDVVESDNQVAWASMARALRLNQKSERTQQDMQSEAAYRTQCRGMLLGDKSRTEGKSTVTDVAFEVGAMPRRAQRWK